MPLIIAAGLGAGALIAVLAFLAEHSRIAIGSYALYGNGAIIVPALLTPWAVYWGWTHLLARGGPALELALFVVGLHLGVGLVVPLDVAFYPQRTDLGLADALPGLLLTGTIFVTPGALLAGLAYWLFTTRLALTSWSVFVAGFVATVLVVTYWVGLGILAGLGVAAAQRDMTRRVPVGLALLVLLLVLGNLPYLPALFPLPA